MTELELKKLMRLLVQKYNGTEVVKTHKNNNLKYIVFEINGWNNPLHFFPDTISVRFLTSQTGGSGMQGKEPRLSRAEISKKFNIPIDALLHRAWGHGRFRNSVGIQYKLVTKESMLNLFEWGLQQYGKKSDEARHKHEKLCMDILDSIFNLESKRDVTPQWLFTGNRGSMRLDGYWEELSIAAEYNGLQHYEMVDYFHKTTDDFLYQLERDKNKRDACICADVALIEIPYHINLTKQSIKKFLHDNYPNILDRVNMDVKLENG